jgi:hypothetical protein
MNFRNKKIIDMPLEKMNAMVDSFSKVSDSKVLSDSEEKELKTQILSFGRCLTKCGNGHLVPPELKDTMNIIEKCDYDITKLPVDLKTSLDRTYEDLKYCITKHDGDFKNTQAKLYCSIYDFFSNAKNISFLSKIRKDPVMKNASISKEDFNEETGITIDSIESWLADNTDEKSFEGIGSMIVGVKAAFTALSTTITRSLISIHALITILIILIIIAVILMITLLVINMQYKSELADILKLLVQDKLEGKDKEEYKYIAAKNMVDHTNPLSKSLFYKPVAASLNAYSKITTKGEDWLNKTLTAIKKSKSKEDIDQSNEAIPIIGTIAAAISGLTVPFWIIFSLICIFMFIKPAVYFIYRLRLKGHQFFKEEADMLAVNIEELKDKKDNCTSEAEKQRLQKIIDKQEKIYTNLSSMAEWFYKAQQEAAVDARDDIRDCDSIDYDKIADENGQDEENPEQYDPSIDPVTQSDTGPQKPIVIF